MNGAIEVKRLGTVFLETKRLMMRQFKVDDASEMYHNYSSNPNVTKFLSWKHHKSIEETKLLLELWVKQYSLKGYYQWAIVLKETNEIIGAISFVHIWSELNKIEVGYCLGEEYWNNGYMSEALKRIIDFCFDDLEVQEVLAKHIVDNVASGKVMKKCGMKFIGIEKEGNVNNNLETVPCACYSIKR